MEIVVQMAFTESVESPHWVIEWRRPNAQGWAASGTYFTSRRRTEAQALARAGEIHSEKNARVDVWRDEGSRRVLVYTVEPVR